MIWFTVAVVLFVAGAIMLWSSRSRPPPPAPPHEATPEDLFEPHRPDDRDP